VARTDSAVPSGESSLPPDPGENDAQSPAQLGDDLALVERGNDDGGLDGAGLTIVVGHLANSSRLGAAPPQLCWRRSASGQRRLAA
jgi:hypothetical protein